MELVYATRRVPEAKGRRFINPRFFRGVEPGAMKVFVERGQERIAESYRAAGVPVTVIGQPTRNDLSAPPEALVERIKGKPEPDAMTDDDLREAIRAATGRRPHARSSREKLLERYRSTR